LGTTSENSYSNIQKFNIATSNELDNDNEYFELAFKMSNPSGRRRGTFQSNYTKHIETKKRFSPFDKWLKVLNPLMYNVKDVWIEVEDRYSKETELIINDYLNDTRWYKTIFSKADHSNYLGYDKEVGYYAVSVLVEVKEKSLDEFPVRVLLRTKKEDLRGTFLAHKSIVNDLPVIYFLSSLSSNISVKNLKK